MIAKCPFRLIYVVLCLEVSLKKTLESSAALIPNPTQNAGRSVSTITVPNTGRYLQRSSESAQTSIAIKSAPVMRKMRKTAIYPPTVNEGERSANICAADATFSLQRKRLQSIGSLKK